MNPPPVEPGRRPAGADVGAEASEPARTVRMSIEVQVGAEPVRGRIGPVGVERDFVGWTELATAIEECTHPAGDNEPTADDPLAG